jgi:glycosyltransferase involved in cell wall biosynthesis
MTPAEVLVLLPVCNGARYLREQLDSILAQDWPAVRMVCRDDASEDDSLAILREYAGHHAAISLLPSEGEARLGASASFSRLMEHAHQQTGDRLRYFALSDQDDIWHPARLSRGVHALEQLQGHDADQPLLIHSDLRVVNEDGSLIAESFLQWQGLTRQNTGLAAQLMLNTVTGCTALFNGALLQKALPVPKQAIMHDWWLALVAAAFGRIHCIDEALVDYRQHGSNALGARKHVSAGIPEWSSRLFDRGMEGEFRQRAEQAEIFASRFASEVTALQRMYLRMAGLLRVKSPVVQKSVFQIMKRLG